MIATAAIATNVVRSFMPFVLLLRCDACRMRCGRPPRQATPPALRIEASGPGRHEHTSFSGPSAGDLREPHWAVLVERAVGGFRDAQRGDAILFGAGTLGFAAGDRDEGCELGRVGRLEAHEEIPPRRTGRRRDT